VPDVAEHHSEHQHVRQSGEKGGIQVGVGDRAVGPHQRRDRLPDAAPDAQLGRRVDPHGWTQRHGRGADAGEPVGEQRPLHGGDPPGERGHLALGHGRVGDILHLRLAGDQV
jgi:hypothetical protein